MRHSKLSKYQKANLKVSKIKDKELTKNKNQTLPIAISIEPMTANKEPTKVLILTYSSF